MGDEVIIADSEKMVLVAPCIAEALGEVRIDTEDREQRRRMVISRWTAGA